MTNVMILGVSPNFSTGMSKISKYLWEGLTKYEDLNVYMVGLQTLGRQENKMLLPVDIDSSGGESVLECYMKNYKIDVLITLLDTYMDAYQYIPELVKRMGVKWICHCNINTNPVFQRLYQTIKTADHLIAQTEFGKGLLDKLKLNNNSVIYHGVNTKEFYPKAVERLKEFTFIAVGTNKPEQKNWMGLLKSFRYLIHNLGVKDVHLKIVSNPTEPGGMDFGLAIAQANLTEYVTIIPTIRDLGFMENLMGELYNSSDCYVSASFGEGFGLCQAECYACGVPSVVSGFSAMGELVDDSKSGYKSEYELYPLVKLIAEQGIPNTIDFAEKMKKIKELPKEEYEKLSLNGVEWANKNTWEKIIPKWYDVIKKVDVTKNDYETGEIGI